MSQTEKFQSIFCFWKNYCIETNQRIARINEIRVCIVWNWYNIRNSLYSSYAHKVNDITYKMKNRNFLNRSLFRVFSAFFPQEFLVRYSHRSSMRFPKQCILILYAYAYVRTYSYINKTRTFHIKQTICLKCFQMSICVI